MIGVNKSIRKIGNVAAQEPPGTANSGSVLHSGGPWAARRHN